MRPASSIQNRAHLKGTKSRFGSDRNCSNLLLRDIILSAFLLTKSLILICDTGATVKTKVRFRTLSILVVKTHVRGLVTFNTKKAIRTNNCGLVDM